MTDVARATQADILANPSNDGPIDATKIIENINATVTARYTLAYPVVVPSSTSKLCEACTRVFDVRAFDQPRQHANHHESEIVHQSLDDVVEAAKSGCHLCVTLHANLDPTSLRAFQRFIDRTYGRDTPDNRRTTGQSVGFASIQPIARDQAILSFRWVPRSDFSLRQKGKLPEGRLSGIRTESRQTIYSNASSEGDRTQEELSVDLILMNPIYAVEPGVREISSESTSTSSDECFEVAKQWIDDCSFNHMKCSVSEGTEAIEKPQYLLDCTIKGPKGAPGVRLIDGQFLDPITEYVTLSHCWGISRDPNGKRIRLNKKTLAAFRQGVATSNLPKTFAEAAYATLKLGFKYLWIDALCIMHDSETDVLGAVASMYRIYGEATVNLAATGAPDDLTGLYANRNVLALQPLTVEVTEGFGITPGPYKVLRSTIWEDLIDSSPLVQRAWVFQERCLAKRTLHYTRNELLWECRQMCCSEVFPKGLPVTMKNQAEQERRDNGAAAPSPTSPTSINARFHFPASKLSFNKRMHHQRTTNWHSLVELYTMGRQSYASDKLLGISGLARQYASKNRLKPSDYIAGMWRPSLPYSLLWRVATAGQRPPKYRAPTWSWSSIDGRVMSPAPSRSSKQTCLEVIDVEIQNKHEDPFGLCQSGTLKVRGSMAKGYLRRTQDYWGHCGFTFVPSVRQIGEVRFESAWFDDRLLKLCEESAGIMVEMLEMYLLPVIDIMERVEGLILCSTMQKGIFKRVGVFEIENGNGNGLGVEGRGPENWDRFKRVMKGDSEMVNFTERLDHVNAYWFASDYTYTIDII